MAHPPPPDSTLPAWRSRRAWLVLATVLALALAGDLFTKWLAFREVAPDPVVVDRVAVLAAGTRLGELVPPHPPVRALGDALHLTLVLNPGAVFGMGAGQRWFLILFSLIAIAVGLWIFSRLTRARDHATHAGVGLILAGGLGNLYDRVVFGCVRDFLHPLPLAKLPFGWTWPGGSRELWPYVSNVADAFLIIGVGVLLWMSLRPGQGGPRRDSRTP